MKIIDLLNKIANGEEIPKKIKYIDYLDYILTYNEETQDYYNEPNNTYSLFNDIQSKLNDEVKILEEKDKEKKIPEKLKASDYKEVQSQFDLDVISRINQVIDYLKSKGEQ